MSGLINTVKVGEPLHYKLQAGYGGGGRGRPLIHYSHRSYTSRKRAEQLTAWNP